MATHSQHHGNDLRDHPLLGPALGIIFAPLAWIASTVGNAAQSVSTLDVLLKFAALIAALLTVLKLALDVSKAWHSRADGWWKFWRRTKKSTVDPNA
jgi:hypothetical protein